MIFKLTRTIALASFLWNSEVFADDPIRVVTSIPDLAWMVQEIGGEHVQATALLRGTENPHYVDAIPDYVRQVADSDMVCIVGLDLEVGYMPPILAKSGNAKVQPAGLGYCEVGKSIRVLEKPQGPIDRSMGNVHPSGNPHYFLSPKSMAEGGAEVVRVLSQVDPKHAVNYEKNLGQFKLRMTALSDEIKARLEPIRSAQKGKALIIEYHKEYIYFLEEYGLMSYGSVEEKPGVPPSAGRLAEISKAASAAGVRVLLAADYSPEKTIRRFQELSGIQPAIVPTMIQPRGKIKSYPELQKHIADKILAAFSTSKS